MNLILLLIVVGLAVIGVISWTIAAFIALALLLFAPFIEGLFGSTGASSSGLFATAVSSLQSSFKKINTSSSSTCSCS